MIRLLNWLWRDAPWQAGDKSNLRKLGALVWRRNISHMDEVRQANRKNLYQCGGEQLHYRKSSRHRYIARHRGARTSMDAGTATSSGKMEMFTIIFDLTVSHPMIVYAKQSKLLHNIHHPVVDEWASDLMDGEMKKHIRLIMILELSTACNDCL